MQGNTQGPEFGTQLIGQTEKTLNAILGRLLAGTGMTEPQWVTLTIAVMNGGTIEPDQLVARVASALKVDDAEARARIDELATAGLVEMPQVDGAPATVTDAGRELHTGIRTKVAQITQRLWGDLPPDELATSSRVRATVLERANSELADERNFDVA
jgi:DNA-binding MarR family transcriptional regulator